MKIPIKPPDAPAKKARVTAILASLLRDRGMWYYGAATLLGAPIWLWKKWRLWRHLNRLDSEFDPSRWTMRFPPRLQAQPVHPADAQTTGPRVMLFTQGWGEVETMKPLIAALRAARPHARLLFTTKHHEAIVPAAQWSDEAVSPLPFDNALSVARWLETNRPDVAIFYERFFYASLLRGLYLRGVPFVVLHARMRRSKGRASLNVIFKRWQLRGLRAICLSSPEYQEGVRQLVQSDEQIRVVGSLKFPHQKPHLAPEKEAELRAWIENGADGAPILAAGSTHPSEEEFVLDAFETVRRDTKGAAPVLLLAPRRLQRGDEVFALIQARGLRCSRRSQWNSDAPAAGPVDVLLLDTLGELGVAYGWAQGVFVGGTLIGNSHNVAEPLIWSVPVSFGPRKGNFEIEQRLCEEAGVGFRVTTPEELAAHWTALLDSSELRAELAAVIDALVAQQSQAFGRTLQIMLDAVDAVTVKNQ